MDLPIEQTERMRAREITVNLCLEPPLYFCPHWTPSLRIRNVPFYTGATQNRFARFHEVATNECVCPRTCILNPAFIGYRRRAANVAPSDLHNFRAGPPPPSRYLYARIVSCRISATRRETLNIKITHRDIGKRWDRTVNTYVTGLPTYPSSASSRWFYSPHCSGVPLF